jgi:hypothetical protein
MKRILSNPSDAKSYIVATPHSPNLFAYHALAKQALCMRSTLLEFWPKGEQLEANTFRKDSYRFGQET